MWLKTGSPPPSQHLSQVIRETAGSIFVKAATTAGREEKNLPWRPFTLQFLYIDLKTIEKFTQAPETVCMGVLVMNVADRNNAPWVKSTERFRGTDTQ